MYKIGPRESNFWAILGSQIDQNSNWCCVLNLDCETVHGLFQWLYVDCFSLSSCANRKPTVTYWDNGACTNLLLNLNQTKWSPWLFRSETVSRYDYGVPYTCIDLGGQGHLMLLLSQRISINISLHTGTHWSYFYKCVDSCFSYSFRVLLGVFQLCAPKTHFWSSS